MKLRQLEAMRAVMVRGTTTHAGELMGITQSAVSRLITQLEEELGLNIFDRRHGRLLVTPEGKQFYEVAQKVLAGIDQITSTARDIRTLNAGALRIIAMPALAYGLLPDTIAKIKRQYENVKISIDIGGRRELEEGIASAKYDFGLATLPIDQEAIELSPLCAVDGVCVLPLDHPLASHDEIRATDLSGVPFISVDPRTLLRYRTDELFGGLGIRRTLGIEAQSTLMGCNLVSRGVGVSIVHPFIAKLFEGQVAIKKFSPSIRFEYGLLFPSGQTMSMITRTFINTLRADLREHTGEHGFEVADIPEITVA